MIFITWIFLVASVVYSFYSKDLISLRLQMNNNLEKNLCKSCFPLILRMSGERVPIILTIDIMLPKNLFFSSCLPGSYLIWVSSMPHIELPMKLKSYIILGSSRLAVIPITICYTTTVRVSRTANLYYLFCWPINPVKFLKIWVAFFIIRLWKSWLCAQIRSKAAIDAP